jgi:hypothetical protein
VRLLLTMGDGLGLRVVDLVAGLEGLGEASSVIANATTSMGSGSCPGTHVGGWVDWWRGGGERGAGSWELWDGGWGGGKLGCARGVAAFGLECWGSTTSHRAPYTPTRTLPEPYAHTHNMHTTCTEPHRLVSPSEHGCCPHCVNVLRCQPPVDLGPVLDIVVHHAGPLHGGSAVLGPASQQ